MDDDSEVVHYASTALAQISKEADLKLQQQEQRYAAAPGDAKVLEEYCDYLESYLDGGFVQGKAAEIQRHQLEQLLKKRLDAWDAAATRWNASWQQPSWPLPSTNRAEGQRWTR